jgi:uncharacterized coiled-coil protein SlyX
MPLVQFQSDGLAISRRAQIKMQPLMANANKANARGSARAGRSDAGSRVRAAAANRDPDPRSLVRALGREISRLPALQADLAAAEQTIDGLRRESNEQRKRSSAMQASLTRLVETLQAINAISHGKRVDRRLAKAQKLAAQALRRVDNEPAPSRRRTGRAGRGASAR